MRRFFLGFLLLLAALPALGQTLRVLPRSGQWVTDTAHLMSAQEQATLSAKLRVYADSTSTQIVVVTLPSLDGAEIAQYATELGHQWGVGGEKLDNGIVILVARDEHQAFIATGRGTEGAVPDVLATRISRNVMAPRFREGQFYAGLNEAVDVLISALQGEFQGDTPAAQGEEMPDTLGLLCLVLVVVIFVVAMASSRNRGNRGGGKGTRRRSGWGGPIIIPGGWGGGGFGGGSSGGGFGGGGGGFSGGGGDFGGGGGGSSW